MKTDRAVRGGRLLGVLLALALFALPATADEHAAAAPAHYIIKVTPTLAYLDVGSPSGATVGADYVVVRPDEDDEGMMIVVGEVRILRVYAGFSIAEITSVEPDEEIAVLHRVMPMDQMMAALSPDGMASMEREATPRGETPSRSLALFVGMDLSKPTKLTWASNGLIDNSQDVSGPSVGVRLGRVFADRLRLSLTYRLSGETLASESDVTQLSAEIDAHLLLRGAGKAGPYLGVGGGLHLLTWDPPNDTIDDSAYKTGFNVVGGLEIPFARGQWSLFAEGGYQGVTKWAGMLDASNIRAYAGIGRNF